MLHQIMETLLISDIWSRINQYAYPGRLTKTYHTFTSGTAAIYQGYDELIFASPHLLFPDITASLKSGKIHIIVFLTEKKLIPNDLQNPPFVVDELCTLFDDVPAHVIMHFHQNYDPLEGEDLSYRLRILKTIFRDKDLESAKPLDRFAKWMRGNSSQLYRIFECILDQPARNSTFSQKRQRQQQNGAVTALPLIQWFFENCILSPPLRMTDIYDLHCVNICVCYALMYEDLMVIEWIKSRYPIHQVEFSEFIRPKKISEHFICLDVLKFLIDIETILRNSDRDILRDYDDTFYAYLKMFVTESILCEKFIPLLDALDTSHAKNRMYNILIGDPTYDKYLTSNFPLFYRVISKFVCNRKFEARICDKIREFDPNYGHDDLVDNYLQKIHQLGFFPSFVIDKEQKLFYHVIQWIVRRVKNYSSYERTMLVMIQQTSLIENGRSSISVDRAKFIIVAYRFVFHLLGESKVKKLKDCFISFCEWYNHKVTDQFMILSNFFRIHYRTEIINPSRITHNDNVDLLIKYLGKKLLDWNKEIESEYPIPHISHAPIYTGKMILLTTNRPNLVSWMIICAGPKTLDWLKNNRLALLDAGTITTYNANMILQKGYKDVIEMFTFKYKFHENVKYFLEI